MKQYLEETVMLNYDHPTIQTLIQQQHWQSLDGIPQIAAIYDYVRNQIVFGYNVRDDLCASQVLADGYGQCNTKTTLLMALLRAVGIPCRIRGFYIHKTMQKGALTGIVYFFAPQKIVHAWTEVYVNNSWVALEGVIVDDCFLQYAKPKLQVKNGALLGYGIAVDLQDTFDVDFCGKSTYIQSYAITDELGIFSSPDLFFAQYHNTPTWIKQRLFAILRKRINQRLTVMRNTIKR